MLTAQTLSECTASVTGQTPYECTASVTAAHEHDEAISCSRGTLHELRGVLPDSSHNSCLNKSCFVGHQLDRSTINYEVPGSLTTKIMGVFLALGSIAFAFGDTILPEIQVSLASMHRSYAATVQLAL